MANASLKAPLPLVANLAHNKKITSYTSIPRASLAVLLLVGCATQRSVHHWFSDETIRRQGIEDVLRQNRLTLNESVRPTGLGPSANMSHHLLQIRFAEVPHVRNDHDPTVDVYRGEGKFRLGADAIPLKTRDVVFVSRGVPHALRNMATMPTTAVVAFTRAFDGKDGLPVTEKE